jgi:hypothetical protein
MFGTGSEKLIDREKELHVCSNEKKKSVLTGFQFHPSTHIAAMDSLARSRIHPKDSRNI